MSKTFQQVLDLVARGEVQISAHGYDELAKDGILVKDVIMRRSGMLAAYPPPRFAVHSSKTISNLSEALHKTRQVR